MRDSPLIDVCPLALLYWLGVGRGPAYFPHSRICWEGSAFRIQFTGATVVACGVGRF